MISAAAIAIQLWLGVPKVCTPRPWDAAIAFCSNTPPYPGKGLREDGRGFAHVPEAGVYTFFGATANHHAEGTAFYIPEGGYVTLQAHSSRLEWVRHGQREPIPADLLYPPWQ